ncbi:hypothetical protein ACFE04_013914 [Oxalis oulophora]
MGNEIEIKVVDNTAIPVAITRGRENKKRVFLVPGIVVANTVIFIVTMYVNDCPRNSNSCVVEFLGRLSFQPMKENPLLGPTSTTLEKMGALDAYKVSHQHQVWRLLTCIWLHAGVFHILANMLSLVFIGIRLEQEFGFVLVGLLYVISGFGGSLSSALFIQSGISVGASGALFGGDAVDFALYRNIQFSLGNPAARGQFCSSWRIWFWFSSWIRLLNPSPVWMGYLNLQYVHDRFVVGLVFLLKGVNMNDHCSWCHYLSCVPTSKWTCNSHASCESIQTGNHLNMTCNSNRRSEIYTLSDNSASKLQQLCSQLCS